MKADQGNNLSEMVYHYLLDMILSMKISREIEFRRPGLPLSSGSAEPDP